MEVTYFDITIEELEERIRQYYKKSDASIDKIDVKCTIEYRQGEWSDAWQRNVGGTDEIKANVNITKKEEVLGKSRDVKNIINLSKDDIEDILTELLKEDNLRVRSIMSYVGSSEKEKMVSIGVVKGNIKNINSNDLLGYLISMEKKAEKKILETLEKLIE